LLEFTVQVCNLEPYNMHSAYEACPCTRGSEDIPPEFFFNQCFENEFRSISEGIYTRFTVSYSNAIVIKLHSSQC